MGEPDTGGTVHFGKGVVRTRKTGSSREAVVTTTRATDWRRPGFLEARGEETFQCSYCCEPCTLKEGYTVSRRGRAWLICDRHVRMGPAAIYDKIDAAAKANKGVPCAKTPEGPPAR